MNASARLGVPSEGYCTAAARAPVAGLPASGVPRFPVLGIATTPETAPGVRVTDAPGFPEQYRLSAQGHVAECGLPTAEAGPEPDRLMVVPPLDRDAAGPRRGRHRTAVGRVPDGPEGLGRPGHITHADPAIALLDGIGAPRHRCVQPAVADRRHRGWRPGAGG